MAAAHRAAAERSLAEARDACAREADAVAMRALADSRAAEADCPGEARPPLVPRLFCLIRSQQRLGRPGAVPRLKSRLNTRSSTNWR